MSKKTKSAETKELELQKLRAETRQAEAEAVQEDLRTQRAQRVFREEFEYSPHARGIFHFYTGVDLGNVVIFANEVKRFAHLNEGKPITVYINSGGGYITDGLALYDDLRKVADQGHHVTTVVRGMAASMAGVLLQAGDTRLIGKESFLMIHEAAAGTIGKLHEMKDDVKRTEIMNRRCMEILTARAEKWDADSLYKKIEAKDWWLSSEEAIENGFADAVG